MSLTDQNGRHGRGRWQQHGDHPRSCRGDKCHEGPQRCSCHNGRVQGNKSFKERYGARLSLPSCVSNHTVTARPLFSHMHMQKRCHFSKVLPMQRRTMCIHSGKSPFSLVWSFWEWKETEKSELVKQKTKCLNCCFFWTAKKKKNKQFEDWIGRSSLLAPLLLSISLYHKFFYHN